MNRGILMLLATLVVPGLPMSCQGPHKEAIVAADAVGPYSGAVLAGDLCFVAGKIGATRGEFAEEAESALDRVAEELAGVGLGLEDVVSATVFLVDMGRYEEFNEIYSRRMPAPYPARACIAVRELPRGAQVEVQVIAARR